MFAIKVGTGQSNASHLLSANKPSRKNMSVLFVLNHCKSNNGFFSVI